MFFDNPFKTRMPHEGEYLAGRHLPVFAGGAHAVLGTELLPPFPVTMQQIIFGLGCFWGAERLFWTMPGVHVTAVGYAGGRTPHPTYEEVCSGQTGHSEVVLVVFDPKKIKLGQLLQNFWQAHDPTQGYRQGNDRGTQYRSAIFYHGNSQKAVAEYVKKELIGDSPFSSPTELTALEPAGPFYRAEGYHQRFISKQRNGGFAWHPNI